MREKYESLPLAELKAVAKARGIKGLSTMKKDDVVEAMLREDEREKQDRERAGERKSQVGSGDRSERIRTYNFPQGRLTDHRIGLTLYSLENIMNGNLDDVIDALITTDRAEKLKNSEF